MVTARVGPFSKDENHPDPCFTLGAGPIKHEKECFTHDLVESYQLLTHPRGARKARPILLLMVQFHLHQLCVPFSYSLSSSDSGRD